MPGNTTHIMKNFEQLATSGLRLRALLIAEAGLRAIDTKTAVRRAVAYNAKKQILEVGLRPGGRRKYRVGDFERVMCVGFGKAAFDAVSELQAMLKDVIKCGFVIDLKEGDLGNIVCKVGSHPYPTKVNIEATEELMAMLSSCTEKDLVLCVVSGGGSALLCSPHNLSCEAEVGIVSALTVSGATIQELNTVRKHISKVKGGRLAELMFPAAVISLVFSDIPGDDISMVASGPTVPDATTIRDARDILDKYRVLERLNLASCDLVETPKEQKYFDKVQNVLVVSARHALLGMRREAEELGYDVKIFSDRFQGLARELPKDFIRRGKKHEVVLGAGESTVKVTGHGVGGRNQEMALAALPQLDDNQVLVCVASDGHDNTDAAGAVADAITAQKAKARGLEARTYLDHNDSYHFFEGVDDLVMTGPTGANVADFFVLLEA